MPRHFWLVFLIVMLAAPACASLTPSDQKNYQQAFHALDAGKIGAAVAAAKRADDPKLRKVILAETITAPNDPFNFEQISDFITQNPTWPERNALLLAAEEKLTDALTPKVLANWFTAHPPITMFAFYRAVEAINSTGNTTKALQMIRARWIDHDFGREEQQVFLERFTRLLRPSDHWARADRLLTTGKFDGVGRMLNLLNDGQRALVRARTTLTNDHRSGPEYAAAVPKELQHDPGLILELLRWARRHDRDTQAVALLQNQPTNPTNAAAWWNEREIQIRRALDNRNTLLAYQLAKDNRLQEGLPFSQAEFMAGWIALRLQKKPEIALQHFTKLYERSTYPITRARAAYWLGRTYAVRNDATQAAAWYAKAKDYPATFYGQIALAELDTGTLNVAEPAIAETTRTKFKRQELVQIALQLNQIGENKRFGQFLFALADDATTREDFVQLVELAAQGQRPDLAVRITKLATQRRLILSGSGFPIPYFGLAAAPEKALVLALMRQESMFTPDIVSPSGARGLMQLMTPTARAMARREGMMFSNKRLFEPGYNTRLGSAYLDLLLKQFDGSIILAVAAYNAGPSRVRGWMERFGDPRSKADPIDWIEIIPIYETRNYVQRVVEGLQVYRAQFNNGHAKLRIFQDLQAKPAD